MWRSLGAPQRGFVGATPRAFDRHAARYADRWDADPAAATQRRRVIEVIAEVFPPGSSVLDAGCGPGDDARWMALRGFRVTAIDASEGMLAEARRRGGADRVAFRLGDLVSDLGSGPYDAALSNFGALNCVPLAAAARNLASVLAPGAPLVAVLISSFCPIEIAALARAGHPREAWRRRRQRTAWVEGVEIAVDFPSPARVRRAFSLWFDEERQEALGAASPLPGRGRGVLPIEWWERVDRRIAAWPLIRSCGDHTLWVLRRNRRPVTDPVAP
jgi:SAM-dependent methyltransferase